MSALAPYVDVPRIHEDAARDQRMGRRKHGNATCLSSPNSWPSGGGAWGPGQGHAARRGRLLELDGDERAVKAPSKPWGEKPWRKLHQTTRGATADVLMNYEYHNRGAAPYRCRTGRPRLVEARRASILR